MASQSEMT